MEKKLLSISAKLQKVLLAILLLAPASLMAQRVETSPQNTGDNVLNPYADMAPQLGQTSAGHSASPEALFDVQFTYSIGDSLSATALVGACWTGTEFWISQWNTDTLWTTDMNGSETSQFTIPGVGSVRSLTFDGTFLYAGAASQSVYQINPSTKTLVSTISAPVACRHLSYDPTLNGGAGGFWGGNWATDIVSFDMSGNTLSTISAATHGLTGMYGSAYDGLTAGGPYLWVFDQGSSPSQCDLVRLSLPTGTPSGVVHDVIAKAGAAAGVAAGSAGGAFITTGLVAGQNTIGGIIQSGPNVMFGYELADFVQPAIDGGLASSLPTLGYSQIPMDHASNITFSGVMENNGSNALATADFVVEVWNGGSQVFTNTVTTTNLAIGGSASLTTSAGFTPTAMGTYDVMTYASAAGDTVNSNDTISYSFMVTDSTYARDDDVSNGGAGYAVSSTDWGYAVALYNLQVDDTLSSLWIQLENPTPGDTTYGVIVSMVNSFPFQVLAQGATHVITGASNQILLEFPGGVPLTAGDYAIGVYEGSNTVIGLSQSSSFYVDGINFFFTNAGGWSASGIPTARFIRPNFGTAFGVNVDPGQDLTNDVVIYPNPTNGSLYVNFHLDQVSDVQINIMNAFGQVVHTQSNTQIGHKLMNIDMSNLANGMYFVEVVSETGKMVKKINVAK